MEPVATQPLIRLARRCWLPQSVAGNLAARCAAAVETSGEYTILASVTAAQLHGLWLPEGFARMHLATATPDRKGRQMTRTQRPEFVAHRFQLDRDDIVRVDGLQVTSIPRTWRDLARLLQLADLVAAGDSALRAGACLDDLANQLRTTAHTPHIRRLREALLLLDARSRSRAESHLRVAVSAPDLPKFEVNEAIYRSGGGGWLAEPDLSLAEARLALEYQGADHAQLARMHKDITRFADLRAERWLAIPFGPRQVFGRPWEVRAEVRALVRERAPQLIRRSTRSRSARPT